MYKRIIAGITASVLAALCAAQTYVSAENAVGDYSMNVSVRLDGTKTEISPYIYGVNEYGNTNNLENVSATAVRQGGNRYTGYNWETNYSNAGHDWIHSSDTNIGDVTDGPAYAAQNLSKNCQKYGVPYKMTTLQMAGYVAADKNGTVLESEAAPSARWNEVQFRKDAALSMTPDLDDGVVYMDEYVNYLVNTLGDATTETGIQGYSLDNEPALWNDTHPLLHGEEVTNSELISKSIELARVVKEIDPNAEVFGPAFWGMLPCIQIGETEGMQDPDWQAVKGNYNWYIEYYLDQMKQAEETYGMRLLDVVDVHYYAQDCSTDAAILQAARSLYDADYQENSWLQPYFGQYFPFLTRLKESIDAYYPGTKLAVSEYNLANIADEGNTGKSVVSAIAEAEALGAFALNEVYLATYWGTLPECPYVESAMNLYTNYDGEGASFGDTLVEAETDDLSKAAAFAAIDGGDDSQVTLVLSNKCTTENENATITFSGTSSDYQSAVVYAVTQDSSDIKIIDVQNDIANNTVEVTLPPLSVAQIVISDQESNATITEEPNVRVEENTYAFSELGISENGYPMIPLGDKEHLKEIRINMDVTSNAGSTWASGGGALCFNKVVQDGTTNEVWGNKPFSYRFGNQDVTVSFDENFQIIEGDKGVEIIGYTNDTYAELQTWWNSSEQDTAAGSDITVTYHTFTLVYEYDNEAADLLSGDVNANGSIGIEDVVLLQRYLLGDVSLTQAQWKAADLTELGSVDAFDLAALRKLLQT